MQQIVAELQQVGVLVARLPSCLFQRNVNVCSVRDNLVHVVAVSIQVSIHQEISTGSRSILLRHIDTLSTNTSTSDRSLWHNHHLIVTACSVVILTSDSVGSLVICRVNITDLSRYVCSYDVGSVGFVLVTPVTCSECIRSSRVGDGTVRSDVHQLNALNNSLVDGRLAINTTLASTDYDIVLLGFPIWYGKVPRVILSFLDAYNFSGKRIRDKLNRYISPIPLSRAAFAERELTRFTWQRGKCQYVICGAGMDTFAFRNDNPNIQVFEIDHPDTQRYKLEKIRQLEWNIPSNVHYVAVDFAKDDMAAELKKAGYDPAAPSFFAILGVTYYLTLPVFEETLERIGAISSFGSKLVFDFPDDTTFSPDTAERVHRLSEITRSLGEEMQHGYALSEVSEALERHGFLLDEHNSPEKIQKRFFDGRSDGQKAYENIHFILAKKGDRFNESYYLYI